MQRWLSSGQRLQRRLSSGERLRRRLGSGRRASRRGGGRVHPGSEAWRRMPWWYVRRAPAPTRRLRPQPQPQRPLRQQQPPRGWQRGRWWLRQQMRPRPWRWGLTAGAPLTAAAAGPAPAAASRPCGCIPSSPAAASRRPPGPWVRFATVPQTLKTWAPNMHSSQLPVPTSRLQRAAACTGRLPCTLAQLWARASLDQAPPLQPQL